MKTPKSRITATKYSVHNKLKSRFAGIFFAIFILLAVACSDDTSTIPQADRDAYINTYVDLTLIQIQFGNRPNIYQAMAENVYKRYNTSREFMTDINARMDGKPDLQEEIYREIGEKLKLLQEMPLDSLNRYIKSFNDK